MSEEQAKEQLEEVEEKMNCTVNIEESGPWKKKISVVVPREEIDKELDSQYGDLGKEAAVPGFRKGRAPRRLIEKRFGSEIIDQAKFRLLAQAFEQIEDSEDFDILGEPDIKPDDIILPETGDFTFEYEVEVKPVFELPKLEGIKIEKKIVDITEDRVKETVEQLRRRHGKMTDIEKAQADDSIDGSATIKLEGIDEPVVVEECPLWVSPCSVRGIRVENMAEILDGTKPGDKKEVTVEVPESHPMSEWRGKKAEITIEVKAIKRLEPAEMNDEFFTMFGTSDQSELERMIEENLEDQADQDSRNAMTAQVREYLSSNVEFELPEAAAARHSERALANRYYELLRNGMPAEQINQNIEQLRASVGEEARNELKMSFIMEKVAETLEIETTDGEVNAAIAQIAGMYRRRPEKVRDELAKEGRLEGIAQQICDQKALERILEMAEVVDAPAEDAKPTEKKTTKKATKKKTTKKTVKKAVTGEDEKSTDDEQKKVKRTPPKTDK